MPAQMTLSWYALSLADRFFVQKITPSNMGGLLPWSALVKLPVSPNRLSLPFEDPSSLQIAEF
jgi:hypothetical protein